MEWDRIDDRRGGIPSDGRSWYNQESHAKRCSSDLPDPRRVIQEGQAVDRGPGNIAPTVDVPLSRFEPNRTQELAHQLGGTLGDQSSRGQSLARRLEDGVAAAIDGREAGRALARLTYLACDELLGSDPAPKRRGRVRSAGEADCGLRVYRCARAARVRRRARAGARRACG